MKSTIREMKTSRYVDVTLSTPKELTNFLCNLIWQSDDDHNSSVSDIDSQPRTPRTPYTADEDSPAKYTNDGLFKIPRDRNDSSTSIDQDYIIAKRTRSKVSLATTSIETIESTFQPPDTTPDMYDRDNEVDTDWLEFLNVLTKPISEFCSRFCSIMVHALSVTNFSVIFGYRSHHRGWRWCGSRVCCSCRSDTKFVDSCLTHKRNCFTNCLCVTRNF